MFCYNEARRRNQQKKANTKLEKPKTGGKTNDTKGKGSRQAWMQELNKFRNGAVKKIFTGTASTLI